MLNKYLLTLGVGVLFLGSALYAGGFEDGQGDDKIRLLTAIKLVEKSVGDTFSFEQTSKKKNKNTSRLLDKKFQVTEKSEVIDSKTLEASRRTIDVFHPKSFCTAIWNQEDRKWTINITHKTIPGLDLFVNIKEVE